MTFATVIFIAVALAILGGSVWLFSYANSRERRETVLARLQPEEETVAPLQMPEAAAPHAFPPVAWVSRLFWRAGIDVQPRAIMMYMIAALLGVLMAELIFGVFFGTFIVVAALMGVLLVFRQLAAKRRSKTIEQLPGFLENVLRVMSAGNSLEEALNAAAREAADPIKPLFLSVSRQIKLGAPVDQVLAEAGALYRLRDLKVMALAAAVNRKYGGSLRGVLKSMITAIRQRAMAARELRALTAETRFSAVVLSAVPIGVTLFVYFQNRHYYDVMLNDKHFGFWLLLSSAGMQFLGAFLLWRMVNSVGDEDE